MIKSLKKTNVLKRGKRGAIASKSRRNKQSGGGTKAKSKARKAKSNAIKAAAKAKEVAFLLAAAAASAAAERGEFWSEEREAAERVRLEEMDALIESEQQLQETLLSAQSRQPPLDWDDRYEINDFFIQDKLDSIQLDVTVDSSEPEA